MKSPLIHLLLPLLLLALHTTGCTPSRPDAVDGDTLALRHATLLHITRTDSFTLVTVDDAWHKGRELARYVLVPQSHQLPHSLPSGTLVRTPLRRVALTGSVHAALLCEWGLQRRIAAMADTGYVVGDGVKRMLRSGHVASLGSSMQPNVETLRAVQADAVWVSPFENAGYGALTSTGIPLIVCADYMEASPLARAEWMRFYGMLMGCGAQADSLFAQVETRYEALRRQAQAAKCRPTLFCDVPLSSTWYQPGGESTMGRLFADAGARYLWADRPERGSLALTQEHVYARAASADLWLVKHGGKADYTYATLAASCRAAAGMAAWKQRHVWVCNTLRVPFFEETPFHPDLLLRDLVLLCHPELVGDSLQGATRYYRLLTE